MKERQVRELCEEAGVRFVSMTSDGKHHKVRVELGPGITRWVSFPKSPSDHRALLNKRAQLKKLSREYGG